MRQIILILLVALNVIDMRLEGGDGSSDTSLHLERKPRIFSDVCDETYENHNLCSNPIAKVMKRPNIYAVMHKLKKRNNNSSNDSNNNSSRKLPAEEDRQAHDHHNNSNSSSSSSMQPSLKLSHVLNKFITPFIFGIIMCVGVVGNALVIGVIVSRAGMRNVVNMLLLNLAMADLLFVLVIPPCTAYVFANETFGFGLTSCRLMHYLTNVTAYVTVYTLVLIALVRFLTIVHNESTLRFRTKGIVLALIAAIWAVACLANSFIFFVYGLRPHVDERGVPHLEHIECDLYDLNHGKTLFTCFFFFAYLLPLVVIAAFSLAIKKQVSGNSFANASILRRDKTVERKKRVGRVLTLVVVMFALLWLPVHVHLLAAYYNFLPEHESYAVVSLLCHVLAYCNSCVNPLIYNCASKEFRQAFRSVVGCIKEAPPCSSTNIQATKLVELHPKAKTTQ